MLSTRLHFTIRIVALWTFRKRAYDGSTLPIPIPNDKYQAFAFLYAIAVQLNFNAETEADCMLLLLFSAMAYVPKGLHARLHFFCARDTMDWKEIT